MGAVGIIGAQWGSEGKGVVAAALAKHFQMAVRVGGPNAGHSFRLPDGVGGYVTHVMRGVPCAWFTGAELIIGAGAVVDPHLLMEELSVLPPEVRVYVDGNAAVVDHVDAMVERDSGLWEAIGSTNEGVGEARIRKIRRRPDQATTTVGQWVREGFPWNGRATVVCDTAQRVQMACKAGRMVMLEGTQGSGLSLHHGTEYPKATSDDTNISGMLAAIGLPPTAVEHTFLVARTLPIRVAGNSGPMGEELDWADIAAQVPGLQPEKTTVTKRVRRISRWFTPVFDSAVRLNDPCGVFLMFADYLVPGMSGTTDADALLDAAQPSPLGDLRALTAIIEEAHRVPIIAYGTGGPGWSLAFRGRCAHGVSWD